MKQKKLSGPAWVEIQGESVLHFNSVNRDHVEYEVKGFDTAILLRDYRSFGRQAISEVLATEQVGQFAFKFNAPAWVDIQTDKKEGTVINLRETNESDPVRRLWIAIGIIDYLPVYDYLFRDMTAIDDHHFAVLALYRRQRSQ